MPANDRIVLGQYLEQRRNEIAPEMSEDKFFNVFVCEQVLKNYDLGYDELLLGIVDGGNDGGIDAMYCFVNGDLVQHEFDATEYRTSPEIELVIVQAKRTNGFSEDAINRLVASCQQLLNLENDLTKEGFTRRYNAGLLEQVSLFREAYKALILQLPRLVVSVYYGTFGDEVHPNVKGKVPELVTAIGNLFSAMSLEFEFLGAGELLALARKRPSTTSIFRISESIATTERANVNLVPLPELHKLLSDEEGRLRKDLFEANVRDYQGPTSVNKDIAETLNNPQSEDFWWLNNGITILATNTILAGKTLTLENVQVVNGLQTCAEVHKFFFCAS